MPQPIFMKPDIYIMAPEPISMAYYISSCHQSMCLCCIPLSLLGNSSVNNFPAHWIHATIKVFDTSFTMWSVSSEECIWLFLPTLSCSLLVMSCVDRRCDGLIPHPRSFTNCCKIYGLTLILNGNRPEGLICQRKKKNQQWKLLFLRLHVSPSQYSNSIIKTRPRG
jgi:hypothetical protein